MEFRGAIEQLPENEQSAELEYRGGSMHHRSGINAENNKKLEYTNQSILTTPNKGNSTISNNSLKIQSIKVQKRGNQRNLKYFRNRKSMKMVVSETKIRDVNDDRTYAEVIVKGVSMTALMDSGANITVMGSAIAEFLNQSRALVHSFSSQISTACCSKQKVIGYVYTWEWMHGENLEYNQ